MKGSSVASSNHPTMTESIDLLASALELQLNLLPTGPITRISNDLLLLILVRIRLQELIHLRLVSHKWKAVIESIGRQKRSLVMSYFDFRVHELNTRFFGKVKIENFSRIKLKNGFSNPSPVRVSEFARLLNNNFSLNEHLVIDAHYSTNLFSIFDLWFPEQITTLSLSCVHGARLNPNLASTINSLTSLTKLDLEGNFSTIISDIQPTLARMEHFSYAPSGYDFSDDLVKQILNFLVSKCTRFLLLPERNHVNLLNWHTIKPDWLKSLTHLSVKLQMDFEKVVPYLQNHCPLLKVLHLYSFPRNTFKLTTLIVSTLAEMPNLTELSLQSVTLTLVDDFGLSLRSLSNVQTCALKIVVPLSNRNHGTERLTRALSAIFPNVEHFNICTDLYEFKDNFENYRFRFPKLQSFELEYFND